MARILKYREKNGVFKIIRREKLSIVRKLNVMKERDYNG